ncbi:hypothetical protein LIER_28026 [Lithospermum erythrorhizon]|uniref:Uncharacterized protein n=1 Tax=Lithospermum erythrorhizon TaxID=34254 RepID=A0AAV3RFR7_LITER
MFVGVLCLNSVSRIGELMISGCRSNGDDFLTMAGAKILQQMGIRELEDDNPNSRAKGQSYNSDYNSDYEALVRSDQSGPIHVVPLNLRTTASPMPIVEVPPSRRPLQPKEVRVVIDDYGCKLSDGDLASLRAHFGIPPEVIMRGPLATEIQLPSS